MAQQANARTSALGLARRDGPFEPDTASRDALIAAARELIGTRGYQSVTVDDIRRAAGVSRATFYFYFQNKRHLFVHLAHSVLEDLYEIAGRHYPDRDEYSRIILANIAYLRVWEREAKICGEFFALSLVDPEVQLDYARYRKRFEDRIASRLERLMAAGRIPCCTNPKLLAAALSSMVEFFAFRFFATDEEISVTDYTFADAVRVLSESWYRAVYGRMPPPTPNVEDLLEGAPADHPR